MSDLIRDFLTFPFLRNACVAAVLAALAAGVVGSLVVVRRSTYLAGAVSHSVLAGIGLSLLLSRRFGIHGLSPMGGAVCVALAVALLLAFLARKTRFRPDTVLSAVWTTGMALGVSFVAATPGYQEDLMSYLFGSILLVPTADLGWMALMDAVILSVTFLCYNRFLAIAFNEELTRLRGIPTRLYETVYHILTALTVVLLVRVAGIVLAVALLTLPAATVGLFARRLNRMMAFAVLLAILLSFLGIALSYRFDWPPGATIVELAALGYCLAALFSRRAGEK
ncbi:MAG: metal ABC transporter permease [Kiritimatiellae bacterium]|nr:metal ABC transporter permease [Kiritimatiellia bacterium]